MNETILSLSHTMKENRKPNSKFRRLIAEDPEWNLPTVPPLVELCLNTMVQNFAEKPILDELLPKHQAKLLKLLPVTVPLAVTSKLIEDEGYWEKCCKARWEICDVSPYDNSWKRMFLEKNLEEKIESFQPGVSLVKDLQELLEISGQYVKSLDIGQLLSPVRKPDTEDGQNSDSDEDDPPPIDHFDFKIAVPYLPNLEKLQIAYGVRECSIDFEWHLFEFTKGDCTNLSNAVKTWKNLREFHLIRSKMNDNQARTIITHLLDHPSLKILDFSYNKISDNTARAIGKLLNGRAQLEELYLEDNLIGVHGASAIAHALKNNKTLKKLSLRHNQFDDIGCIKMCHALKGNRCLTELHLGSNGITEASAVELGQLIMHNKFLLSINLSCNKLSVAAGKIIREGMEENISITRMDLRLTDVGQELEYDISQFLKKNNEIKRRMIKK